MKTKTLRLLWRKKTEFLIKMQETRGNVHIVYSRPWIHKTNKQKKKKKKKKEKRKRNKNFFFGYLPKLIVSFLLLYIKRGIIYWQMLFRISNFRTIITYLKLPISGNSIKNMEYSTRWNIGKVFKRRKIETFDVKRWN